MLLIIKAVKIKFYVNLMKEVVLSTKDKSAELFDQSSANPSFPGSHQKNNPFKNNLLVPNQNARKFILSL